MSSFSTGANSGQLPRPIYTLTP
jgi:hypothetical protein